VRVVTNLDNILPFRILDDFVGIVFFRQYARNKNPETLQTMFLFLTKASALLLLPIIIVVAVFGDIILTAVFGQQYSSVHGLVSILSVVLFFNTLRGPLSLVLLALERNDIVSLSRIAALYNIFGYIILTPLFGIYGIAIATCSATILQNILLYYFAVKYAGVRMEWQRQSVIIIRFTLLGVLLVLCRSFSDSLLFFVAATVLGTLVFTWWCWVSGVFHANERQIVREFVAQIVGRPFWGTAKMQPTI